MHKTGRNCPALRATSTRDVNMNITRPAGWARTERAWRRTQGGPCSADTDADAQHLSSLAVECRIFAYNRTGQPQRRRIFRPRLPRLFATATTIQRPLVPSVRPPTSQPGPSHIVNMATELAVQSERAFQKQPHIFQNGKVAKKSTRVGKGGRRWYKDVGLGFKTPANAINGTYIGM